MARLANDGQPLHVGDVEVACPAEGCDVVLSLPVMVEPVDTGTAAVALRAQVNVDPAYEHARKAHRLSRPRRR